MSGPKTLKEAKEVKRKLKFDPEGDGYDYETALEAGISADSTGHWPSREPKSGRLLKGRRHKTWELTVKGEREAGYEIYKGADGHYYSRRKESK